MFLDFYPSLFMLCKKFEMSYECAWGWHDRYDIYVHIKFKCAARNFTGRVIQSTGNGMGTCARKIMLIASKEWQNCGGEKTIILHWRFVNLIRWEWLISLKLMRKVDAPFFLTSYKTRYLSSMLHWQWT